MLLKHQVLAIVILLCFTVAPAKADLFSEAAKLGANVGAMKYCSDHFADSSEKKKYNFLRLKTLGEYNDLEREAKAKALIMRKASEDKGEYLGQPLDEDRCNSIRKLLILKY